MALNLNEYTKKASKYLRKDAFKPREGRILTIDVIKDVVIKNKDGKEDLKPVIYWVEGDALPMTLNKTNLRFIIGEFGPEEHDYAGRKVEVWHDPTVEMGGQMVGGLKLRLPRGSVPAGGAF